MEPQIAVDVVDRELMQSREIGGEQFVLPATRSTALNADQERAFLSERIERLPSRAEANEEPSQETGAVEGEQARVDARDGLEPGGGHELVASPEPHNEELPQEFTVPLLKDEAPASVPGGP